MDAVVQNASRRKPSEKRRNPASHVAVLRAASDLLVEKGYCSVTIDQIAARAGVGKQTIYRWWPTKIAIYIELYNESARQSISGTDTGTLEGDVAQYARGLHKQLTNPVASLAFKGMIAEAQTSAESLQLFRDYMLSRFALSRRMIRNAVKRGEISPKTDLDSISSMIGGAVVWRLLLGDRAIDKKFVAHLCKSVLEGLLIERA